MEKLKTYVTKKNLMYGCLGGGVLALILFIMYMMVNKNMDSFSGFSSALSTIRNMCVVFYLDFIVLLVLTAAYAYRLFYEKDHALTTKLFFGCQVFALLMSLLSFSAVRAIHSVASGDFGAVLSYSGNMDNTGMWLVLMLLAQVLAAAASIYFVFVKKAEDPDAEAVMDDVAQGAQAMGKAASKAASAAGETMNSASTKFKEYYATEKGKRNVRITGAVVVVVVVALIAFNVYQSMKKTPIELTSSCEVSFDGVSGEGNATVSCHPDYDHSNEKLRIFMDSVTYTVEGNGSLKNGDTAVIKAEYSKETADSSKVDVQKPTLKVKVKDLEVVYKTFADIPKDSSDRFEDVSKTRLEEYINEDAANSFLKKKVTIEKLDLIGVYYEYSQYSHTGTASYMYRAQVVEDDKYSTNHNTDYYEVRFSGISANQTLDLSEESDAVSVHELYMFGDKKTDKEAIEDFKSYKKDLETVRENLTDVTYQDKRKDKD